MEPVNTKSNSQANNSASEQTENVQDQQDRKAEGIDTQPHQGAAQPATQTPANGADSFGLDSDAPVNNHVKHNTASHDNRGDDVAQIQDMLLNGEDPTKVLPETAAGTSLKSGGGFDFVTVNRTGAEVIASSSYQTQTPAYDPADISFGEKEPLPGNVAPSIGDNHGNPVGDVITVNTDEDTEVSGKITITDFDNDDVVIRPHTQPAHGNVTISQDGDWTYTPESNYNGKDSFTIEVDDGKGGTDKVTVDVNVVSVNDTAEVNGDNTGAVTENDNTPVLTDHGKLTVNDIDAGESHFKPDVIKGNGTLGDLTIDANGEWHYSVDNSKVNDLPEGITKQEDFTVTTEDGTKHTITVTITGTNDGAAITGDSIGEVKENDSTPTLTDHGKLTVDDADTGESHFKPDVIKGNGTLGDLTIDANGEWHYSVDNNKVNDLPEGITKQEDFTVTTEDGTKHTITVTITGTNDGAAISGNSIGDVQEDISGKTTAEGSLTVSDADNGQSEVSPKTVTNDYGTFSVDKSGHWSFTINNDSHTVQALGKNDSVKLDFPVSSVDGTDSVTVTITVAGTNDGPQIAGTDTATLTEDNAAQLTGNDMLSANGALTVSDVDTGESHFKAGTFDGQMGKLTLTKDGHWHYEVSNDSVQKLGANDSPIVETFTVETADGTSHNIVVTIKGTDDQPEVSGTFVGNVAEGNEGDAPVTATGTLTITDADQSDHPAFENGTTAGKFGSLELKDGHWTYTLDESKVQALPKGHPETDSITLTATDGTQQTITIHITGTNDKPVVDAEITGGIFEGNPAQTVILTDNITDVDGDSLTVVDGSIKGLTDGVTVNGNTLTVDPSNSAFEGLKEGETKEITVTYQVTDGMVQTLTRRPLSLLPVLTIFQLLVKSLQKV